MIEVEPPGIWYAHYKVFEKEYYAGPYNWKDCLLHEADIRGYEYIEWTSIVPEKTYERSKQDSADPK